MTGINRKLIVITAERIDHGNDVIVFRARTMPVTRYAQDVIIRAPQSMYHKPKSNELSLLERIVSTLIAVKKLPSVTTIQMLA